MTLNNSRVSEVRRLTDDECEEIGLPVDNMGNTRCLVLESDGLLLPVSDVAMNSGGGWRGEFNSLDSITGQRIKSVEPMSDDYMEYLNWDNRVGERSVVITFENDTSIYTASDPEGNGAGLLFQYADDQVYQITFREK